MAILVKRAKPNFGVFLFSQGFGFLFFLLAGVKPPHPSGTPPWAPWEGNSTAIAEHRHGF